MMTVHYRMTSALCGLAGLLLVCAGLLLLQPAQAVLAQDATPAPTTMEASMPTGNNSYCLLCHAEPKHTYTLTDGSSFDIQVNPTTLAASVHGVGSKEGALGCVDCHGADAFPHTRPLPTNRRNYSVQASLACVNCHQDQVNKLVGSVHYQALAAGNLAAATCVDCHGSHDAQSLKDAPIKAAETCEGCHVSIATEYRESVHGASLNEGDTNVPTCISCHGGHDVEHPTTVLFRNNSPQLCANCHADEKLMTQYNISTNVFNSYLADFHGQTVALFEQLDPNAPSNKAVCIDCHGVHDITPADADNSRVIRENLLATCQQCHPDASSNFPSAWLGHFPPTQDTHPLLYWVNLFYQLVIPVTIAGFLALIATDIFHRIRTRGKKSAGGHHGA